MATELKVGGTVYHRNGNPVPITGETSVSWIVGSGHSWDQKKLKKSEMRKGNSGEFHPQYFVEEGDALDCLYATNNSHQIARLVDSCRDGKILRQIAALIGYTEG